MSARPLLIRQARLLDPAAGTDQPGDLLIIEGRIAATGSNLTAPDGAELLNADGHLLAPGLVDLRTHLREPGYEHEETLLTGAEAAVAGGVTALACLADTDPVIETAALVDQMRRRSDAQGLARILPYGAVTQGRAGRQLTEIGLLTQAGAVGFSDCPKPLADALVMRRALAYARTFDQLILSHPEQPELSANIAATEGELATRMGLPAGPVVAEQMQVERDIHLAELTGGRLHVGPLSTHGAIEAVRQAKKRGVRVTCDTAPHYFALNETAIDGYRTFAKVSPPLRNDFDRRAVVIGLADGTIDAIASDHAPFDQDSKRLPFIQAAAGVVGLETMLPLALELVHGGHVPLMTAWRALSRTPAEILRQDMGSLAIGTAADLVLVDLDRPWRIDSSRFRSKCRNTPFDRRPVQGRVLATWVGGAKVWSAV